MSNATPQLLGDVVSVVVRYVVGVMVSEGAILLYINDEALDTMAVTVTAPFRAPIHETYLLNAVELLGHLTHRVEAASWVCCDHNRVLQRLGHVALLLAVGA